MHQILRTVTALALLVPAPALAQITPFPDCNGNAIADSAELDSGALEDCNRDGIPDICSLQPSFVFSELPPVRTVLSQGSSISGAQLADVNADGNPDALIAFSGQQPGDRRLKLFIGDGSGSFADGGEQNVGSGPLPLAIIAGSLGVDVVLSDSYFQNDGSGNLAKFPVAGIADSGRKLVAVADLTGDGRDDVLMQQQQGSGQTATYSLFLHVNQGNGAFSAPELVFDNFPQVEFTFSDLTGDGGRELIIARPATDSTEILIFQFSASGAVSAQSTLVAAGVSSSTVQIGDVDQSGKLDLLLGTATETYRALDFSLSSSQLEMQLAGRNSCGLGELLDIDGDGDLDFFCQEAYVFSLCCPTGYRNFILNDGTGFFFYALSEAISSGGSSIISTPVDEVFKDLNGDGKPDSVLLRTSGLVAQPPTVAVETRLQQGLTQDPAAQDLDRDFQPDSLLAPGLSFARYSLWNSFAGLTNILELANPASTPANLRVQLRSSTGSIANAIDFSLNPGQQFDLILNDFSALAAPGYGLVEVLSSAEISGAVSYYRQTPLRSKQAAGFDVGEFDFAFQIPLASPAYRERHFLFNSYQPSAFAEDIGLPVLNWLTIVSLAPTLTDIKVETYLDGNPQPLLRSVSLSEFGRIDLDGGHGLANGFARGFHKVTPETENQPYLPLMIRYGSTFDPERFSYAFPAFGNEHVKLVSTGGGATTWLEIANSRNSELRLSLIARDTLGGEIRRNDVSLPPSTNEHYLVNELIGNNATGTLTVQKISGVGEYHAQVVSYFYSSTGAIQTAYLQRAADSSSDIRYSSYNLFLDAYNWLRIVNLDSAPSPLELKVLAPGAAGLPLTVETLELPGRSVRELDIHNGMRFGTSHDSYGLLVITPKSASDTAVDLLRIRPTSSGGFDFIMPVELR